MTAQREDREPEGQQDWQPCPTGEVGRMLASKRRARQISTLTKFAGVAALLIVAVSIATSLPDPQPVEAARIRCSDVKRLADDYLAQRLNTQLNQRVEDHLSRCPGCRRLVDAHRHSDVSWFHDPSQICLDPHCTDPRCHQHRGDSPRTVLAIDDLEIQWPDAQLAFALPFPSR